MRMTPRAKMMVKSYAYVKTSSRPMDSKKLNAATSKKKLDSMPRHETFKKVQIADETSIESHLQYNGTTVKPKSKQGNKRQHLTKSSMSLPKDENYNDQTITSG